MNIDPTSDPVNISAAKMFWKAPWWAKVSEPNKWKPSLNVYVSTLSDAEYLEYSQSPPIRGGRMTKEIFDRRGDIVELRDGKEALVIGYAETRTVEDKNSKKRGRSGWRNRHYWWAVRENKVIKIRINKQESLWVKKRIKTKSTSKIWHPELGYKKGT